MSHKVFLSYRRSDTASHAMALKLVIEQYFSDVVVFVDTDSIKLGEDWPDRLSQELETSTVLLALMGSKWRFAPDGRDRFADPKDWVRVELARALSRSPGTVLPIKFVDSTDTAAENESSDLKKLPDNIKKLSDCKFMELRTDSFLEDVRSIALALAEQLGLKTRSTGVEYPRPNTLKSKAPVISQHEFDNLKHEDDSLSGWRFSSTATAGARSEMGSQLNKMFEFKNFKRAFSFMNEAALAAESHTHHPVWENRWNKVDVCLRTFDAGHQVTWYDIDMAGRMNEIASAVENAPKPKWPYILKSR